MFVDKIPVKFHFCHAHVGSDPEKTDAQTYDAQKRDSEETDQQVKIPDPVAFHQLFALLHDLLAGKIGIIQIKQEDLRIVERQFQDQEKAYEQKQYHNDP